MTDPHTTEASITAGEKHTSDPGGIETTQADPRVTALTRGSAQQRLQAALSLGTTAEAEHLDALVTRCGTEPDFFVRDMITWALTRMPVDKAVDRLVAELDSTIPQAISQALHTLAKIGDARGWEAMDPVIIGVRLIAHEDVEVARSAWRSAVALVPGTCREMLARALCTQLGRGDLETQKSLSRALVSLGEDLVSVVDGNLEAQEETVRAHALATRDMYADPDVGFAHAMDEAKRVLALGSELSGNTDPSSSIEQSGSAGGSDKLGRLGSGDQGKG